MSSRTQHRKLAEHLRSWSPQQIAALFERRPDLAQPTPPADMAEMAQRAQQYHSLALAIASTSLPENRLLQLVVCCRPDVTLAELAACLPDGVTLEAIEAVLDSLERSALVWRHAGHLHCSGALYQAMPTTLGPPFRQLVGDQTVEYLKHAIRLLRAEATGGRKGSSRPGLPAAAIGPQGRPPRKAELLDELEALLATSGVVEAVLASAPAQAATLARSLAAGPPVTAVEPSLYFSPYGTSSYYTRHPAYWLFERALLLPVPRDGRAAQPREVGVVLRGGKPVPDLALEPPPLAVDQVDLAAVDKQASQKAAHTLERLADLLERWAVERPKQLKSGGLGAAVMKQVAAALDVDTEEAARLVELLHLAGLVDTITTTHREKRQYIEDFLVAPSAAAPAWLERPLSARWRQLVVAWARAEYWPSASGRKDTNGRTTAVMSPQHGVRAAARRGDVLTALTGLGAAADKLDPLHSSAGGSGGTGPPGLAGRAGLPGPPDQNGNGARPGNLGEATSGPALAAHVYWHRPQPWLEIGADAATAIRWTYEEAELLGVVAAGRLSSFGRALVAGDARAAERALRSALPVPAKTFTVQADLTAVVVGGLDRDVLSELRLMADAESKGAASTFRFSEGSLRRAIDAGRDAPSILAFLEAHAAKGVPQALAYLVSDVARRHGHLRVGSAGSFVTTDDPAVLADACSHRRTRRLDLRLLAPTVAVSPLPPDKVTGGLRDAGFFPAEAADQSSVVTIDQRPTEQPSPARRGSGADETKKSGGELPERYSARKPPSAAPLGPEFARQLAEALCAPVEAKGRRLEPVLMPAPGPGAGAGPGASDDRVTSPGEPTLLPAEVDGVWDLGADPDRLEDLLRRAAADGRVLAVSLGRDDEPAGTILLAVTEWEPGRVQGLDLDDGLPTLIASSHIAAAIEVGSVDDYLDLMEVGSPPAAPTRPHKTRKRRRRQ